MPVKQSDETFINTRCHLSKEKPKGCQAYEIFRAQQMIYEQQVRR